MSSQDPITENYFRKAELAEILDVSIRTLDRWEAQRIGPPRFKMGNVLLYPKAAIMKWLEENTREPKRVIHPRSRRTRLARRRREHRRHSPGCSR